MSDELEAMSQSERMRLAGLFADMRAMNHPLLRGECTPLSVQAATVPPNSDELLGPGDSRKSPQVAREPETLAEALAASAGAWPVW